MQTLRLRFITLFLVALLPFASACSSGSQDKAEKTQPGNEVDKVLMQTLHKVSMSSLDKIILPDSISLLKIAGPPVRDNRKPTVLYMGADYCPYCAAIRWPLVLALTRFGDFTGLKYMRSSADDVYAKTVTFSFHNTRYESDYLTFEGVELQDREGKKLETPDKRQLEIFRTFNAPPYTRYAGAIPFLYMDGEYMQSGSPFSPGLLKGLSWKEVADKLGTRQSAVRQTLLGVTNLYTAAICKLTNGQPEKVCDTKAVNAAAVLLPDEAIKPEQ